MNHAGHMFVGLLVGAAAAFLLAASPTPTLVALVVLGSILPDIDLYHSKASKVIHFVAFVGGAFVFQPLFSGYGLVSWLVAGIISLAALLVLLIPLRLKHRGITHSWGAAFIFGVAAALAAGITGGLISLLAYASHLIVDRI